MFKLINTDNTYPLTIVVTRDDMTLEFDISTIISNRNKKNLIPSFQFKLLNDYLNYKGEGFKDAIFKELTNTFNTVITTASYQTLEPIPYKMVYGLLDLLDLEDIVVYLKTVVKLNPYWLVEEFNTQIEADDRGSRVQTYTQNDYVELAALTLIVKIIEGPLGFYALYKNSLIPKNKIEYTLLNFIRWHPIYKSSPMAKLYGFIQKPIELPLATADNNVGSIRIIEKQIPYEELAAYILSIILFRLIATSDIINDNKNSHIVTSLYTDVNVKLNTSSDTSNAIRSKTPAGTTDGDMEKESVIEQYRLQSEFSIGQEEEMDWAASDFDNDIRLLKCNIVSKEAMKINTTSNDILLLDMDVVKKAREIFQHFLTPAIASKLTDYHFMIMGNIFKDIRSPNTLKYVSLQNIALNQMVISYAYLWAMGYKELAVLLASVATKVTIDDQEVFNNTSNKSRVPVELKDTLQTYCDVKSEVTNNKTNILEYYINTLSNNMYTYKWVPMCGSDVLIEVYGEPTTKIVPANLKVLLSNFIIDQEKRLMLINPL